jgi:putative serine protease PepD
MRPLAAAALAGLVAGCGGVGARAAEEPAAGPSVLLVRVATPAQRSGASATGFALGRNRLATVAHVLDGGRQVSAGSRPGRVLRVDRRLDLAVLAVRGVRGPMARAGAVRSGEAVTVRVIRSGETRSLPARVRRTLTARVRGSGGRVRVRPALELAAAVMPGDSGAPVLDRRHRVVGMIFAQASDRDAVAYALDVRTLLPPAAP